MSKQQADQQNLSTKDKRLALLIWFRLVRFFNDSIKRNNKHLQHWDLTMAQFDALNQIGLHQPMTQQQLSEKLEVTKGNITQLLKRLEEADLIHRKREWKTKYISLTSSGQQLYEDVVPQQERFQVEQFNALSRDEQTQLLYLLKKLQKNDQ